MKIVHTFKELRQARHDLVEPVGLIPTMGYLHAGHLSLIKAAHKECASVVVSIFVNPTQFGPKEDFSRYPRDIDHDLALLEAEKVDIVWIPENETMYPQGYQTWVTVDEVTKPLEGELRPGHFKGVTTVVTKLFNGVSPQKAFFGQKDAQQAQVISRMVADLNMPIEIKICPILREKDGLAMSSRNVYLSPEERKAAPVLHRALKTAEETFLKGETNSEKIKKCMLEVFAGEPLAKIQYISIVNPLTFEDIPEITEKGLILLAVYFGTTRLIDNLILSS